MEKGNPSVTADILIKALFMLGVKKKNLIIVLILVNYTFSIFKSYRQYKL